MKQMIFNNQDRLVGIAAKALVLLGGALVALSLALAMSGCTDSFRENDYPRPWGNSEGDDDDLVPVEFTLSSQRNHDFTRAESSIVSFNSGETIKVFVSTDGGSSYTDYDYTTAAAGQEVGLTAPASPPYFPNGSASTVQAYAYYPATAGASATFSVADNQTSDAAYKSSDLMYAANRTITKGSSEGTKLQMAHKMVQLCITANAASGSDLSIYKVKVNAKKSVTFTPADGTATTTGDNGDVIALTQAGTGYVLIPPQLINNVTIKIETDAAGSPANTATFDFASASNFEAGYSYSLNLTVSANLLGITTTTSITNWNAAINTTLYDFCGSDLIEAIDLGLPSGTKWANMNIGATSVTDYGYYFAWGETTGYTSDASDGRSFDWSSYKFNPSGDGLTFTKYNSTDGKTVLDPEDDAATANWGSPWRMPTENEFAELINSAYTTATWTSKNGVYGNIITSKSNGNSIFLPAAGGREGNYVSVGGYINYWVSSFSSDYPQYGRCLAYWGNFSTYLNINSRYIGYTIRPVQLIPSPVLCREFI